MEGTAKQLIAQWLQVDITGSESEAALSDSSQGDFCVRRSKSQADAVVLVLRGPSNSVHHYQFKRAPDGTVSIKLGGKQAHTSSLKAPFTSFAACLEHYVGLDPEDSGLVCRVQRCIAVPHGLAQEC